MKAGPKRQANPAPLPGLDELPAQRGHRAVRWVEEFVKVPRGKGARAPLRLRPWQRRIVRGVLGAGVKTALVSLPRANGKSALAAALALYGVFGDGEEGAIVPLVASDERQARIVLGLARRMVELDPRLEERTQVYADRLYVPGTDSTVMSLPAEPGALQGYDVAPLAVVDELHVCTRET